MPSLVHDLLTRIAEDPNRETVRARIRASGTPLYTTDLTHPGMIVEVRADGARTLGHFEGRSFVPAEGESSAARGE